LTPIPRELQICIFSHVPNGQVIVIGAWGDTVGANYQQGAAYVFVKPKGGWKTTSTFDAKLIASAGKEGDGFGASVAVSGNTAVASAAAAPNPAYLYVRPHAGWKSMTETAQLRALRHARAVGPVSMSGDTVAASIDYNKVGIFAKPRGGWRDMGPTAVLTGSDVQLSDGFGIALAIDGLTAVVGSPFAQIGNNYDQGAGYLFVRPAQGWKNMTQTAKLTASDGMAFDTFGTSAGISGSTVAFGAPYADSYKGWAYVYVEPKGGWKTTSKFEARIRGKGVKSNDGFATGLSFNGDVLVVGSPLGGSSQQGVAYVFGK
jgi:FG-GAP repeat